MGGEGGLSRPLNNTYKSSIAEEGEEEKRREKELGRFIDTIKVNFL